ncbi:MAG: peptidoglycan DD-metalloendopeptidase family protein [Bacteroidota bacterium]
MRIATEVMALIGVVVLSIFLVQRNLDKQAMTSAVQAEPPVPAPTLLYGIPVDSFQVEEHTIKNNQFLSDILLPYNVPYVDIDRLVKKAKDVFDVRKLQANKKYTLICDQDSSKTARYFVYDPSPYFFVVYDLQDTMRVTKVEREIEKQMKTVSGIVFTSLWDAIVENGQSWEMAVKMEDIFGWSVDFHHLQEGDRFKLLYEEHFIEGQSVGIGDVSAAHFQHRGSDNYGFYYEHPSSTFGGYYFDEKARPMKKAFLKAPVKYTRISSAYNLRRFHPVLRRVKPHLGTDYAAPYGTPIYAVADGTISRKGYTKGNGNFVKIKHDKTYSTQYLHMQKFGKGMGVGVHVKQGQVIGYVGSTGLATGPHVCFRFWKNGKQVDHRREKLPPPEPMPEKYLPDFYKMRDSLNVYLEQTPYLTDEEIAERRANNDSTYVVEMVIP